jgi:hypothetical protein
LRDLFLRNVVDDDLEIFFEDQQDPQAKPGGGESLLTASSPSGP